MRATLFGCSLLAAAGCSLFIDAGSLSDEPPPGPGPSDATADAIADGGSEAAPGNDAGSCPAAKGGPMVRVTNSVGTVSFCIDATEVTEAEYDVFLAEKNIDGGAQPLPGQPPACASNNTYEPEPFDRTGANFPVTRIDWCDAYAYCAWAGKRLCGKIGGGQVRYDASANAAESQWMFACSAGGQRTYPYGDSFDPNRCASGPNRNLVAVKSFPGCEGGFPGLFDMSGNLEEWEDSCDSTSNRCQTRGGSFADNDVQHSCPVPFPGAYPRNTTHDHDIGIRCCAD